MQAAEATLPDFNKALKSNLSGDPEGEAVGYGLQTFPLVASALGSETVLRWEMSPAEQVALLFVLGQLRPKVAIEIGTRYGGSLQVLSKYCGHVYSLDIDPEVPARLEGRFPNVTYLTGPSEAMLPPLIERLQAEGTELTFILVDGGHTTDLVRADIDNVLKFKPTSHPLYVVMHDSMNPACRRGLQQANWAGSPYVHAVELDFVPGSVNTSAAFRGQLWGGLALGILLPRPRTGPLEITERSTLTFSTVMEARGGPLALRAARKLKRMLLGG